jgi:hypothetical protein
MITGTVVNGSVVPDAGRRLPEGAQIRLEVVEEIPPDHPMAPYNRELEIALLRESIAETKAGYPGRPLEEVMAEIAAKYNLPPVDSDPS